MSNETKQTAVDIAFQKLANSGLLVTRDYKNIVAYREAKEMEKEQCITFYVKGCIDTYGMDEGDDDRKDAETWYNETYGGNK